MTIQVQVVEHPRRGRELIASKDFEVGELVFTEKAYASCPSNAAIVNKTHCFLCCSSLSNNGITSPALFCEGCSRPFCSKECASSIVHELECRMIPLIAEATIKCEADLSSIFLIFRCIVLQDIDTKGWADVSSLANHREKHSKKWLDRFVNVSEELKRLLTELTKNVHIEGTEEKEGDEKTETPTFSFLDPDLFSLIACIIDVNAFAVLNSFTYSPIGTGVFYLGALMSHSCNPNAFYYINGNTMEVRAIRKIKKGEPVFDTYVDLLDNTIQRQKKLAITKYFWCECERCRDLTENERFLTGISCLTCKRGWVVPFVTQGEASSIKETWECSNCHSRITDVTLLLMDIEKSLDYLHQKTWTHDPLLFIKEINEGYQLPILFHSLHPNHQNKFYYCLHMANAYSRLKNYEQAIYYGMQYCNIAQSILPPTAELSDCFLMLADLCENYSQDENCKDYSHHFFSLVGNIEKNSKSKHVTWKVAAKKLYEEALRINIICKGEKSHSTLHIQNLITKLSNSITLSTTTTITPHTEKPKSILIENICEVCKTPSSMSCSGCHKVYYCSKEHQKLGWKDHKKNCRSK